MYANIALDWLGERMPREKGGRGKKNPSSGFNGFSPQTAVVYRKVHDHSERLEEYCGSVIAAMLDRLGERMPRDEKRGRGKKSPVPTTGLSEHTVAAYRKVHDHCGKLDEYCDSVIAAMLDRLD